MEKLFGIPTTQIALALVIIIGIISLVMAFIAFRNKVMFRMGIRNIPRRKTQTMLIVMGLTLGTIIISSALGTGDTITHTFRKEGVLTLGPLDERIDLLGDKVQGLVYYDKPPYFSQADADGVIGKITGNDKIDGVSAAIVENAPGINLTNKRSDPSINMIAIGEDPKGSFGHYKTTDGQSVSIKDLSTGSVFVNDRAVEKLGAKVGDTIKLIMAQKTVDVKVQGIINDEGSLSRLGTGANTPVVIMPLPFAQDVLGQAGQVNVIMVSNNGDTLKGADLTDEVMPALKDAVQGTELSVQDIKLDAVKQAELIGNTFVSIFVLFGLFSITAGLLLIFMIFVMLAAERKPEMGMARAVGAQRRHIIQMFLFEGGAYDVIAASIGAVAGVAISYGMVKVMALALSGQDFNISFNIQPKSVVIGLTIGIFITFVTVLFSSWRVSKLNIVTAVRNLPEEHSVKKSNKKLIFSILLIALGALMFVAGRSSLEAAPFMLGVTLFVIGACLLSQRLGLKDRIAYTTAGLIIVIWHLLPFDIHEKVAGGKLSSGIEIFFLSGITIVAGAVWVVIFNSDILLNLLMKVFGRGKRIAPVLKTALSYPMMNRFRTGMTILMFSIVLFTLTVMMVITNGSSAAAGDINRVVNGYQIVGVSSYQNPVGDIKAEAAKAGLSEGTQLNAVTSMSVMRADLRQNDTDTYASYVVKGIDPAFAERGGFALGNMARGYDSKEAVWAKVASTPGFAVVDPFVVPTNNRFNNFAPGDFKLSGFFIEDKVFDPVTIEIMNATTGDVEKVTVIGVLDSVTRFFTTEYQNIGVFTSQAVVDKVSGAKVTPNVFFATLKPGADAKLVADGLESGLAFNGLQTSSIKAELEAATRVNSIFNYLITGFMGLGLLVGIAALGVITARSVVERRQQIGMMRAIGFQKGMVEMSILIESSFVSLLGIFLGIGLGLILAWNVSQSISKDFSGFEFTVPWLLLGTVVAIAYLASLSMAFLPARQASSIQPAEALRYE